MTKTINLTDEGVFASVVGLTWHDGAFYITHRNESDFTGAVSRVAMDGDVAEFFSGLIDSKAEHEINDIRVGADGRMYVAVGLAGNAGVISGRRPPPARRSRTSASSSTTPQVG